MRVELINDEEQELWRVKFGRVQLCCPFCFQWFKLGKDFKIDSEGNVDRQFYHHCDNDDSDAQGWVALVKLVGWKA